ncbi:hypothetical protein [Pseudomonas putida]|uniref:hypothetical protein n=1 Tax=Pseudomonas putida TaxID=303 RepID=UPI00095371DF|nr:hypothetical protein [Pseudomonas putida]SIR97607.1 hypothetical protein SAMN05216501_3020 [Pseudomonas putida]
MDKVVTAGCVLLLAVGYLLGAASGLDAKGVSNLKSGLELVSFVATVSACCVAIYSLNIWRKQFRHAKEFEVLSTAHRAVNDLKGYKRYAMTFMHLQFAAKKNLPQTDYYQELFESLSSEWELAHQNVVNCLGEVAVICDKNLAKMLSRHREKLYESVSMVTLRITGELYEEANPDVARLVRELNQELHDAGMEFTAMQEILISVRQSHMVGRTL